MGEHPDDHLVIAVCDNAHESFGPVTPRLHWSVPDPVRVDTDAAFEAAYTDLAGRIDRLAPARSAHPYPTAPVPGESELMNTVATWRRLLAEFLGTMLLVTAVVGSGIMATDLSPDDVGLQLLQNSVATALALGALILTFGPVSGAHFNPVVSAADWFLGRRSGTGLTGTQLGGYILAQTAGAIGGSVLGNLMFDLAAVDISTKDRTGGHLWLGEVVATSGLLLLVFALARAGRAAVAPAAVGAYIGAAYWFTSSTSFANPAVTVGRTFTDTFAGIAPGSLPGFIAAQLVGLSVGVGLLLTLYPGVGQAADDVVVAHHPADVTEPAGHR